jgi:hypothetical protein
MKWAALETEVSPSNFTFAAKDIVCYPRVQPAAKLKLERGTERKKGTAKAASSHRTPKKAHRPVRNKNRYVRGVQDWAKTIQTALLRRKTSFAIPEFRPPQN